MNDTVPVGVLLSGRGSNFAALLRHQRGGAFQRAIIACVASDNPEAAGLTTARDAGIPAFAARVKESGGKTAFESSVVEFLRGHGVAIVVLAGYMRLVGPVILQAFPGRILNIHPSLLPSFPGLHAQRQALDHGVRVTGCTVHFVDAGLDSGPIIGQRAVPVMQGDTEETLSARILEQEHELYAESLCRVTEQAYEIVGRTVVFHEATDSIRRTARP